jgi:hypothetical protein
MPHHGLRMRQCLEKLSALEQCIQTHCEGFRNLVSTR